jgi:hypothetical protein
LFDFHGGLKERIRTDRLDRLKIARDEPQIGPNQIDVRNAVTLNDGTVRFSQRSVPVQAMTHQGQSAVRRINFGL